MTASTRTRSRLFACAVVVGVLTLLTACGEDDPFAAYCDEVATQQTPLTEAQAAGPTTGLLESLPSFEALEAEAPDDIRDEWSTITRRISVLAQALEDAGVDPATYDRAEAGKELEDADRAAIDAAARELARPELRAALDAVQQQARDVCKTPLTL